MITHQESLKYRCKIHRKSTEELPLMEHIQSNGKLIENRLKNGWNKIAMMERKKSNENSAGIDEKSMENQSKVYGRIANDGTYRK